METNTKQLSQEHINFVMALYSSGKIQETIDTIKILDKNYPNVPLFFNILGACYKHLNKLEESTKMFEIATEIKPDYYIVHNNLGINLLQLGKLDAATDRFKKAIAIKPDYIDAHYNLCITIVKLGQLEEAVICYEKAITIKPDFVEAHNNLGSVFKQLGQLEEAARCYERAITIKPDLVEAHYNLGYVLQKLGDLDAAVRSYKNVVAINSEYAMKHNNKILYAIYLFTNGHIIETLDTIETLIKTDPYEALLYNMGGGCYTILGELDKAIKYYEKALNIKPDYAIPQHMLNALTGKESKAPPREYVKNLFDDYAERFDYSLVIQLEYKLPFLIKELILKLNIPKKNFKRVIDIGCGTGLLGSEIRDISENLIGIDISKNMISKAKNKEIYDRLIIGDIVDILRTSKEKYDLFISLDVFIYLGELSIIFNAVRNCSYNDAIFIFSIELQEDKEYSLLKSGRYSHSEEYILKTASNGFKLIEHYDIRLRKEKKGWINGKIFVLQVI